MCAHMMPLTLRPSRCPASCQTRFEAVQKSSGGLILRAAPATGHAVPGVAVSLLGAASLLGGHTSIRSAVRKQRVIRIRLQAAAGLVKEKSKFLALLKEKGSDCSDKEVIEAIDALAALNPTKDAARTGSFLDADWRQVSKSTFPGEIRPEVFSLGRLAFNLYEPTDMEWQIDRTLNPVRAIKTGEDGEREYEFWIDLSCVDSRYPKFKGQMKNYGMCKPDPKNPDRLEVWFTGGSFMPAADMDPALLDQWKKTFGAAFGAKKPTIIGRFTNWAMKMMMGLKRPEGVNSDGSMTYEMAQAPHGYTDILYMDDDLRITKGNRGTIVVVDRPPTTRS